MQIKAKLKTKTQAGEPARTPRRSLPPLRFCFRLRFNADFSNVDFREILMLGSVRENIFTRISVCENIFTKKGPVYSTFFIKLFFLNNVFLKK